MSVEADVVVNCAGLHAQEVAGSLQGLPSQFVPERHLARGCYFALQGEAQDVTVKAYTATNCQQGCYGVPFMTSAESTGAGHNECNCCHLVLLSA